MTSSPTMEAPSETPRSGPAAGQQATSTTPPTTRRWLLPGACALVAGALVLFLSTASLDSIEQRSLAPARVLRLTAEHLALSVLAALFVGVLGVTLGVIISRRWARRFSPAALAVANIGQAVPDVGILVLLSIALGLGNRTLLVTMVLYTILPVLRNTLIGIIEIAPTIIDAGRGQGMSDWQILWTIQLHLAVPAILAGLRTSLLLCVGVAAAGAFIGAGGLGTLIIEGIVNDRPPVLLAGALVVALLALALDWLASICEQALRPRGLNL